MYLDHFGLRESPFNITPNPRFLFMTPTHRRALDHLTYGVTQRRGFILLTGDVGAGKTTLCRELLDHLGDEYRTALILDPRLSETQLLRAILHELGRSNARGDRLSLRQQLNRHLLDETSAGRDVVLIIDEAQHLTLDRLEQIRLLSNLETDHRKLLQIILSGQPELGTKLAHPQLRQLRQRITVRYHLGPIAPEDAEGYIRHRMSVAGSGASAAFERDAVGRIHEHASGIPRLVNAISDMSLLAAYAASDRRVTTGHVRSAVNELQECLT